MAENNTNEEIEVEEDSKFSRRTFLKFFMGISAVLTVVPFAPMIQFFFTKKEETGSAVQKIANINDVPPGSTHVFFYPGGTSSGSSRSDRRRSLKGWGYTSARWVGGSFS